MSIQFDADKPDESTALLVAAPAPDDAHARHNADKKVIVLLTFFSTVTAFMQKFGIYAEGVYFDGKHQFNFCLLFPVMSIVCFGALIVVDRPCQAITAAELRKWWFYGPVSLLWSFWTGFILTSNTYTPNIFQVILLQLQLVFGYLMNRHFIGNKFSGEQTLLVVCVVLFNLLLIGNEVEIASSIGWVLFWQMVFGFANLASVVSNSLIESYFKSIEHPDGDGHTAKSELMYEYRKVVVLNFAVSLWQLPMQLTTLYITYPVHHSITAQDLFSSNFWNSHGWSFYMMVFGSMTSNIAQFTLLRYSSLTFVVCPVPAMS